MLLSSLSSSLPVNQILAFNNRIKARVKAGESLHNLTIGDFDPGIFPIPTALEAAIIKAYRNKQTSYPMAEGNAELRAAVSGFVSKKLSVDYTPSDILVAAGGRPLIYATYRVIVDPGDKVIYPVPSWNNQYYTVFTNAVPCIVETGAGDFFMPTAGLLEPHIKDAVLIALCSPQNPTGTCFTKKQLEDICDLVIAENKRRGPEAKKLYIMYDQIYNLLTYGDAAYVHPVGIRPEMKNYVIYIDAISKSFAATGVRVGWAYGPADVISKMKLVLSYIGAWAPMPEQVAVAEFLNDTDAVDHFLYYLKNALQNRLNLLYKGLMQMKQEGLPVDAIAPEASLYLSFKIEVDMDLSGVLLEEAGIAVLPFPLFGAGHAAGWYRMSVGTCRLESIPTVLKKLRTVIGQVVADTTHG
ncbi:MAG: pyridoxal phosphate-dependent aminotransferase [Niabella sp.]